MQLFCLFLFHGLGLCLSQPTGDPRWRLEYSHRPRELREQGLCWHAGDTLSWGKAQGRAETSALWTPSSWKASPHYDLLKEQPALHTKPSLIGPRSCCSSRLCDLISLGPLLSPTRAALPQTPTPQTHMIITRPHRPEWSLSGCTPKACQVGNPQTFTISTGKSLSGLPGCRSTDKRKLHSARPEPFRHTRPLLQRPTRSLQQQASTCSPVGPHPPVTHHRKAPNLPRRQREV
jgi:hypothetical protein